MCDNQFIDNLISAGKAEYLSQTRDNSSGKTILIAASEQACLYVVQSLINAIASEYLDMADDEGNTALIASVKRGPNTYTQPIIDNMIMTVLDSQAVDAQSAVS